MSGQNYRVLLACALMSTLLIAPAAQALSRAERSVIKRINKMRAHHGLKALHADRKLARAADAHCRDMLRADFFAHTSSNGTSSDNRIRHYRRSNFTGETLAYQPVAGNTSPARIVRMWRESPGHFAVLTEGRFRRIGVAKRRGTLWGQRVTVWTADLTSAH